MTGSWLGLAEVSITILNLLRAGLGLNLALTFFDFRARAGFLCEAAFFFGVARFFFGMVPCYVLFLANPLHEDFFRLLLSLAKS